MSADDFLAWERTKASLRVGDLVEVTVTEHIPFGVVVDLPISTAHGLIEFLSLYDTLPDKTVYPAIGTKLEAVVIGFADHERQVRLSAKPCVLERARRARSPER